VNWHLLVIDLQPPFATRIPDWGSIVERSCIAIEAAKRLQIPITATEQNPEKLGPTVEEVAEALAGVPRMPKMTFSCLRDQAVWRRIVTGGPTNLLIVGVETHVCVLQTALDALRAEPALQPYIAVDAVGSRKTLDRDTALRRLERAGAILTTVESAFFEILERAGTDKFRSVLPLFK